MGVTEARVGVEGRADRSESKPCVHSEVGRLRSVLVHRPGDELRAIDGVNARRWLYSGPIDVEQAQSEHDAFAELLRARDVEVLYVERLLAEIARDAGRRDELVEQALPRASTSLRARLARLSPARLARSLIAGTLPADAVETRPHTLRFVEPVPNLLFARDPSVWIGPGRVAGAMASPVRRRESALLQAMWRLQPRFADAAVWTNAMATAPQVEGGDLLVSAPRRVVIGISPRTSASGANRLATALLTQRAATEVVTLRLPRGAGIHLDLVLTAVDRDTFAVWAPVRRSLQGHSWRTTSSGVAVSGLADPLARLSSSSRVVEIAPRPDGSRARPWDHGINVLAVAPGVVIAYGENEAANAQLEAAGIEVLRMSSRALAIGCGGPRCLSCPVLRDEDAPHADRVAAPAEG